MHLQYPGSSQPPALARDGRKLDEKPCFNLLLPIEHSEWRVW